MLNRILNWMLGMARQLTGRDRVAEPTPEMPTPPDLIGEMWMAEGIPPPRDPRAPWYQSLSVDELWKELSTSENANAALVTLKRPELNRGYFNGVVLISEEEIQRSRQQLLEISGVVPADQPSAEIAMPIMSDGRRYPAVVVKIEDAPAVKAVVSLPTVEAVEPLFVAQDGVGCALDPYTPKAADGMIEGNLIPWTFTHLGVLDAWNLYGDPNTPDIERDNPGYSIRIGVVDTGVDANESQLRTVFNLVSSNRRSPARHLTVVPPRQWDDCGHGTRIAGLATAPLDSVQATPRKIAGVAWGANLTTVKYNSGVVAFGGSRVPLINAIGEAINDGAKVVNLALGMAYWSGFVYDNIVTYYNTTQTIFVGAAGTFVTEVVFPAAMEQVLAVGIVKSKDTNDPQAGYELYGGPTPQSAYGKEVDFVAVNADGDTPTTGGLINNPAAPGVTTLGGSSSGTAHLSGIIALAWGKEPSATRDRLISRLKNSSSVNLISGVGGAPGHLLGGVKVGYGIPDAYVAAGGSRRLSITGPTTVVAGASYTLKVTADGWLPLNYKWDTGQSTDSVTFTAGPSGTINHSVTATNPIDGNVLTAQYTVLVASSPSHLRFLYSDPPIVHWPPYALAGGKYNEAVNYGVTMPEGCAVLNVYGQGLKYVDHKYVANTVPVVFASQGNWGWEVTRPGGASPRNLDVDAIVYHDALSAVRVRIGYWISEPDGVDANVPGATVDSGWPAINPWDPLPAPTPSTATF